MANMAMKPEQQSSSPDPRPNAQTRLAIERTLLAWIRTGLAMMGFGFVLDRFGFFLRELSRVSHVGVRSVHVSLWSGILLITLALITTLRRRFVPLALGTYALLFPLPEFGMLWLGYALDETVD